MTGETVPTIDAFRRKVLADWPAWVAGGLATLLLLVGLGLWARSGVEIYFTILLNGLARCF